MSTQQDIYVVSSENRPPMLNKDNYVPWSSHLLRYANSKPNKKLLEKSILHGSYTDDELTEKDAKQVEADDQAIQIILMGLPKDVYAVVDSYQTARETWLRVQQMMKGYDIGEQEKKAKLFNEWERMETTCHYCSPNEIFALSGLHPVVRFLENESGRGQYRQMQMVGGNGGNQYRQYDGQNARNQIGYNTRNQNVYNAGNQNGNGNVVAARAEGNGNGNNANQIRCYNCRGMGHYARNCTVRPRRRDVAYLQTQLLIAQKEEAGIQLQAEEFVMQASTSSTHIDKAPVYDSDRSAEPTTGPHLDQQNDSNVIPAEPSMDLSKGTVEQHHATVEETRAFFESLYNNLFIEVEKVNIVNRKMKEANVELVTKLARYKGQEKYFEFNQAKFDELENGYKIKDTIVTLQRVVKSRMSLAVINWSSFVYQEVYKILKDEIASIVKFERKRAYLESSCKECKYEKNSYDKAYNDMQHRIERLQAQLGDLKGRSMNTQCASDTLDPLSQKLDDENVSLEFQVMSLEKENEHLNLSEPL
ncbi:ribonuclease H-like domain-containing protein [Tanacetum coccineum]